ncbi:MAG TPA: GTPase CgtA [Clostridiales bacterium]|nr:GTPase CgtA [Clostridiales bacterium]
MFIDNARIRLKAGNGGNGKVSFHREKYVSAGGPDGGDGGRGGDILILADEGMRTLADFKYMRKYEAQSGEDGQGGNCSGKNGNDLLIRVPLGTLVIHGETGRILADMLEPGQTEVIARGGQGGKGNQHFATPTRQAPEFAKPGKPGEELVVELELKSLADVGLIGFPNVGKSTILSMISAAKPKIANYHFTTLEPKIGVVRVEEGKSFLAADIPGLIEGAHQGTGLGHEFLRHIERTRLLLHVVDVSGSEGRDPVSDVEVILRELREYSPLLAEKPQIIVANKMDLPDGQAYYPLFEEEMIRKGYEVVPVSAATGQGLNKLVYLASQKLDTLPAASSMAEIPVMAEEVPEKPYTIRKENGTFIVEGRRIQNLVYSVNMDSYTSMQYFQRVVRKMGLIDALVQQGVREGDRVKLYDVEFEYTS